MALCNVLGKLINKFQRFKKYIGTWFANRLKRLNRRENLRDIESDDLAQVLSLINHGDTVSTPSQDRPGIILDLTQREAAEWELKINQFLNHLGLQRQDAALDWPGLNSIRLKHLDQILPLIEAAEQQPGNMYRVLHTLADIIEFLLQEGFCELALALYRNSPRVSLK